MADALSIRENIGPLLESLQTYQEFAYENDLIDSEEYGVSVQFQKEGEDPAMLAKPSLALFHGDPVRYREECQKLRSARYEEVLQNSVFIRNRANFDELARAIRANKVTPFVGAGASIAAGCSSWPGYLESRAREAGIEQKAVEDYLATRDYETLLQAIIDSPGGLTSFEHYFQQDFAHTSPQNSFAWELPSLFQSCVITTNFDRVLEDCYSRRASPFIEKSAGLDDPHNFIKAVTRGQRYLLKLHGNVDDSRYRVFTPEEYRRAYSDDPDKNVVLKAVLPKLLAQLYQNHSFLFLGCSLHSDRTVSTFELLCEKGDRNKIADHFAILERPDCDEEFRRQERKLIGCNIKPVWYESGQHEKVGDMLSLLSIGSDLTTS